MANPDDVARAKSGHRNLSGADLIGAVLSRANLTGADLSVADLIGADLNGAEMPHDWESVVAGH